MQLAHEALQTEPANESALRALARAQLERGAYEEALAAADKLAAEAGSAAACSDGATVLAGLAHAVTSGQATLPVDAGTLQRRARASYQRALAADADDRSARAGLAALEASQQDPSAPQPK